jgi:hypothetical protein
MRALLILCSLLMAVPASAASTKGFDKLLWGMSPDEVRAAYPDQIVHEPKLKTQPDGTVGGRLLLSGKPKLFDQTIEVSAYFGKSGLAIVRLNFPTPADGNIQKVLDWHEKHWGAAIVTTKKLDSSRTMREWSWPWEGVQLREVKEDGRIRYQRIDYTASLQRSYSKAEASVCSILPSTSECAFADRFCAQQDSSMAAGRREQAFPVSQSEGKLSCKYRDYERVDVRLVIEKPDPAAADWIERILRKKLGEGLQGSSEDGDNQLVDTAWPDQGVTMRVVKKILKKSKDGKIRGRVDYLRVKRDTR